MHINLGETRKKTVSASQYLEKLEQPFREKFWITKQTYQPKQETLKRLKELLSKYLVIAFSAEWCKNCATEIPVLAVISETTGLETRIFGDLKRDPLNPAEKWRIPPSPPEVIPFAVDKIPLIIVFDMEGREIGRIVEKPTRMPTLEEEIHEIIKYQQ